VAELSTRGAPPAALLVAANAADDDALLQLDEVARGLALAVAERARILESWSDVEVCSIVFLPADLVPSPALGRRVRALAERTGGLDPHRLFVQYPTNRHPKLNPDGVDLFGPAAWVCALDLLASAYAEGGIGGELRGLERVDRGCASFGAARARVPIAALLAHEAQTQAGRALADLAAQSPGDVPLPEAPDRATLEARLREGVSRMQGVSLIPVADLDVRDPLADATRLSRAEADLHSIAAVLAGALAQQEREVSTALAQKQRDGLRQMGDPTLGGSPRRARAWAGRMASALGVPPDAPVDWGPPEEPPTTLPSPPSGAELQIACDARRQALATLRKAVFGGFLAGVAAGLGSLLVPFVGPFLAIGTLLGTWLVPILPTAGLWWIAQQNPRDAAATAAESIVAHATARHSALVADAARRLALEQRLRVAREVLPAVAKLEARVAAAAIAPVTPLPPGSDDLDAWIVPASPETRAWPTLSEMLGADLVAELWDGADPVALRDAIAERLAKQVAEGAASSTGAVLARLLGEGGVGATRAKVFARAAPWLPYGVPERSRDLEISLDEGLTMIRIVHGFSLDDLPALGPPRGDAQEPGSPDPTMSSDRDDTPL
jgi:hypothetical protein